MSSANARSSGDTGKERYSNIIEMVKKIPLLHVRYSQETFVLRQNFNTENRVKTNLVLKKKKCNKKKKKQVSSRM